MRAIFNKSKISYETYIFAYLMYFLNSSEMNANIAQIGAECKDFIKDVSFACDANNLFKKQNLMLE